MRMRIGSIRAILAFAVVGVFMLITGVLALYPLFGKTNVDLDAYASFFSKTASVYTGIVGVIIGYYFGRNIDRDEASKRGDGGGEPV